jgi:CRP/FNR family cyclic AMP-dependent transcriptional regulator
MTQILSGRSVALRCLGNVEGPGLLDPAVAQPGTDYLRSPSAPAVVGPAADPAVRRLVAAHPALRKLPEAERAALLRWSRIRAPRRQEVICQRGDPVTSVILVLDGYMKLSTTLAAGDEVLLDIIGPGDCVGEMSALLRRSQPEDLVALTPCRLLMIDARHFLFAFERQPEGLMAILKSTTERLCSVTEQAVDYRALNAPGRLAKALLRLARLPPCGSGSTTCLPLRFSQGELGAMIGMSRESVNKHLGAWRDAGWVRMSGGSVLSIDVAALSKLARDEGEDEGDGEVQVRRRVA